MDQILLKKFFEQQAIKKERVPVKNVRKVWTGQKKAFRHEEHKTWRTNHRIEQYDWKRNQRKFDNKYFWNYLKVRWDNPDRVKKGELWDIGIFVQKMLRGPEGCKFHILRKFFTKSKVRDKFVAREGRILPEFVKQNSGVELKARRRVRSEGKRVKAKHLPVVD